MLDGKPTRAEDVTAKFRERPFAGPLFVRSNHPNAYRSGQWASVEMVLYMHERHGKYPRPGRPIMQVKWIDGTEDWWPLIDPAADYEFSSGVKV
jgi:hypothetical protein